MVCRSWLGGLCLGAGLAGAIGLQPTAVPAQGLMALGAGSGQAGEFQSQVGDRVFFSDASVDLGSRGRLALEAQAAWLLLRPSLSVTIEGHADDAGSSDHNMAVSQRRAEVVRRVLVQKGVAPDRISVVAHGRDRPVAQCGAPECAAQNRRAVTIVGPSSGAAAAAPVQVLDEGVSSRRSPRRLN